MDGGGKMEYALCDGVRVRREEFGLLFYNSADTKLTFVRSGDLLGVIRESAGGSRGAKLVCNDPQNGDMARVERLIGTLLKKGLIGETGKTI